MPGMWPPYSDGRAAKTVLWICRYNIPVSYTHLFAWDVIEEINTINAGVEPLYRTIGTNNMVGYVPLAPVQAAVVSGSTTVTMYVPNLVEGLNDVQILYYNQATHTWELMAPSSINYATKEISVTLSGTTPFTIVYKK